LFRLAFFSFRTRQGLAASSADLCTTSTGGGAGTLIREAFLALRAHQRIAAPSSHLRAAGRGCAARSLCERNRRQRKQRQGARYADSFQNHRYLLWKVCTSRAARLVPSALVVGLRKALERAPVALGRPALERARRLRAPAAQILAPLALLAARFGFLVQLPRLLGRPALVGERLDRHLPLVIADAHRDGIAGLQVVRRLDARIVQLDAPGRDRLLREAPGLEKPRRPKPFVDSHSMILVALG